jgi:hypothetical protein
MFRLSAAPPSQVELKIVLGPKKKMRVAEKKMKKKRMTPME